MNNSIVRLSSSSSSRMPGVLFSKLAKNSSNTTNNTNSINTNTTSSRITSIIRNKSSSSAASPTSKPTSKPKSALQGDAGNFATHAHHKMTTFLSVATPLYFLAPQSLIPSDGSSLVNSILGTAIAINISSHSWIGMNYVVTDYIPKVSKAAVGPARVLTAFISGITLLGLVKLACNDKGGIKGAIVALWNKDDDTDADTVGGDTDTDTVGGGEDKKE